jgi:hypothetical protein
MPANRSAPANSLPSEKSTGNIAQNVADAKRAINCGVDIVVAQGWEAGGHVRGTVATMPLIPAVVDAVSPVPVVAAGGIADGRGLAAALALGASGAWIGTRFLASEEATIHPRYREHLLQAGENDTVFLENLFDIRWPNAPHRVLTAPVEPGTTLGQQKARRRHQRAERGATNRQLLHQHETVSVEAIDEMVPALGTRCLPLQKEKTIFPQEAPPGGGTKRGGAFVIAICWSEGMATTCPVCHGIVNERLKLFTASA